MPPGAIQPADYGGRERLARVGAPRKQHSVPGLRKKRSPVQPKRA
jgi:hypothetical protein